MTIADMATVLLLLAGAFFFLAGTVGILRFPDTLTRLHAMTKADNLGLGLVVLALVFQADTVSAVIKLLLIWALVLVASATSSFVVAGSVGSQGTEDERV